MNVLILTGRFGMGHVKCAEAIKEEIKTKYQDANVTVIDFCDYCFPRASKLIYKGFELCVFKFYDAYNKLAKFSNHLNCVPFKRVIYSHMEKLMCTYSPDLVVADLPMCVQYFSSFKKKHHVKIPFYVYITDITIHKDWISKHVDKYFVGDRICKRELIDNGIRPENIHVCGIPVSASFTNPTEPAKKESNVLIMGGGLGLIPCQEKILTALNNEPGVSATIICGKNEELRNEIIAKYKNINAIGFTDRVSDYLKKSDVIITKPGGITTFEAIKARTPLYVIEPTLEQELGNSRFIKRKGLGVVISNRDDFSAADLIEFIHNTEKINKIKDNMRMLSERFESANPVDYIKAA